MLVQGDREHPRVRVERGLHAVPVVHVDVDVGDPVETVVEQPGDRHRAVVVDAEPGGPVGHGVVQPTGDVHRPVGAALGDLPGGQQRTAAHQRTRLVHVLEDRVVLGAQPVPDPERRVGRRLDRGQVGRQVHPLHLGVRGLLGHERRDPLEHPEPGGQPHGQIQPDRVQRVLTTEVVAEELRGPDDRRARTTAHERCLPELAARPTDGSGTASTVGDRGVRCEVFRPGMVRGRRRVGRIGWRRPKELCA